MATPEEEGQEDHEKCVRAEVGGKRKVGVQRWRPNFLLHPSKVWCLESDQREELLSKPVTPEG